MNKKCLIFVPHPDDEVNIGGGLYHQLKKSNYRVHVVIATNGDFVPRLAITRANEAVAAQQILGYDKLIFLGYGDKYVNKHLYDTESPDRAMSVAGHSETYNIGGYETFRFQQNGIQSPYNRESYKCDIKDLVLAEQADLIICVGTDSHQEHRCLSLLFEEAMGEILKETPYKPVVLTKFAYLGVYCGKEDYFSSVAEETKPRYQRKEDPLLAYPFNWHDRLQFQNSLKNTSLLFWRSSIFKALLCHKSQGAFVQFTTIANGDDVYWWRNVNNIALDADIQVSSGNPRYINDFKIVDTDEILSFSESIIPSKIKCWHPSSDDKERTIHIRLKKPTAISAINIYSTMEDRCSSVVIAMSNGYEERFEMTRYPVTHLLFKHQENITEIYLRFEQDRDIYVHEIEVFAHLDSFPFADLGLERFEPSKARNKSLTSIMKSIYRIYRSIKIRL